MFNLREDLEKLGISLESSELDIKRGFKNLLGNNNSLGQEDKFIFIQKYYTYFKKYKKGIFFKKMIEDFGQFMEKKSDNWIKSSNNSNNYSSSDNISSTIKKSNNSKLNNEKLRKHVELELVLLLKKSMDFEDINDDFFKRIENVKRICIYLDMDYPIRINPILVKVYITKIKKINFVVGSNFEWVCINSSILDDVLNLGKSLGCDTLKDLTPVVDRCFNMLFIIFENNNIDGKYVNFYHKLIEFSELVGISKNKIRLLRQSFSNVFSGKKINMNS